MTRLRAVPTQNWVVTYEIAVQGAPKSKVLNFAGLLFQAQKSPSRMQICADCTLYTPSKHLLVANLCATNDGTDFEVPLVRT